jgi:membrane associated rhomboid family serine protease
VASLTTSTSIAWWAHAGGFATGFVAAPILSRRR